MEDFRSGRVGITRSVGNRWPWRRQRACVKSKVTYANALTLGQSILRLSVRLRRTPIVGWWSMPYHFEPWQHRLPCGQCARLSYRCIRYWNQLGMLTVASSLPWQERERRVWYRPFALTFCRKPSASSLRSKGKVRPCYEVSFFFLSFIAHPLSTNIEVRWQLPVTGKKIRACFIEDGYLSSRSTLSEAAPWLVGSGSFLYTATLESHVEGTLLYATPQTRGWWYWDFCETR